MEIHITHYCDVIMNTIACQITSLTIVYLTVNSDTDQRKHQSSASLAFVRGIHRRPVNSPHKGPVTRKMFSFDDVIMLRKSGIQFIGYQWHLDWNCSGRPISKAFSALLACENTLLWKLLCLIIFINKQRVKIWYKNCRQHVLHLNVQEVHRQMPPVTNKN